MSEIWKPSVTVAAIIERNGLFFLVEEETSGGILLNQPAGHLEPNESLQQAVVRETLEETAHDFMPTELVGMYMSRYISSRATRVATYLRFAFAGTLGQFHDQPLDRGIIRTVWMSPDEMRATTKRHRSDIVMQCVDDYLAGTRAPLSLLYTDPVIGSAGICSSDGSWNG